MFARIIFPFKGKGEIEYGPFIDVTPLFYFISKIYYTFKFIFQTNYSLKQKYTVVVNLQSYYGHIQPGRRALQHKRSLSREQD